MIAKVLNRALEQLGIAGPSISTDIPAGATREARLPQCFVAVSQYEHSVQHRKIIGSAQKRSREAFLQHGSILLDFDSRLQQGCIRRPDPEIEKKIAPLNRLLGRRLPFEEIASNFSRAFEETFKVTVQPGWLTSAEEEIVLQLEDKYRDRGWIEGRCR